MYVIDSSISYGTSPATLFYKDSTTVHITNYMSYSTISVVEIGNTKFRNNIKSVKNNFCESMLLNDQRDVLSYILESNTGWSYRRRKRRG